MTESRSPIGPSPDATAFVSIQYEPVAEIGSGGMGTIVLARALTGPKRGSFVAIKRLFPHLETEPQVLASFLDEVWLTSKLHHPNVVEPLDWGRDERGSYLVMQFVMGDSLRALLNARELTQAPLPVDVAVDVIARAAAGLHAAHSLKNDEGELLDLVHRDVSPSNVMIGYDGSVKLIDFGVAKARNAIGKGPEAGLVKGKYAYMSPEQIRGELHLDRRSDVFALGVVAWETLTLCRLYAAQNEIDILRMVCEEEPVPPGELRPGVPPELDRIVLRCLAKNPDERYPDCQSLINDLRTLGPASPEGRRKLATIAREAMAERLKWIEQVTGEPAPLEESPLAVAPDATMRTEPPSEKVLEAIAKGIFLPPTPFADPTVVAPSPFESAGATLRMAAVPDVEDVRGKAPPAGREGSWSAPREVPIDPAGQVTTTSGVEPLPAKPSALGDRASSADPLNPSHAPASPPVAEPEPGTLRYLLLIAAFGAIVFFATMIGAWLGRR